MTDEVINVTMQQIIANVTPVQITVTPAPTPIPATMATTFLDWQPIPVFGIPLWVVVGILSLGALIVVIMHWWDMSGDLDAIKPWFVKIKELRLGKQQVVRLSRAGNFIPDCLDIFDNVLAYGESEENINMWHLNSPQGMIKVGSISSAIISEDWDQNRDIVTEIAVLTAAEFLEKNLEALRIELNKRHKELVAIGAYPTDAENPANIIMPIRNGMDYIGKPADHVHADFGRSGRMILQLIFPHAIPIDAYSPYNQNKFRKFWFRGNTSALFGGENIRRVEDEFVKKSDKDPGFFAKYGAMLIGALVLIGCIIAGAAIPL